MNGTSPDGFTVKEILLQLREDVRGLSERVDDYIKNHDGLHLAERTLAGTAMSDPTATLAGKSLLADIADLAATVRDTEARVEVLEKARSQEAAARQGLAKTLGGVRGALLVIGALLTAIAAVYGAVKP